MIEIEVEEFRKKLKKTLRETMASISVEWTPRLIEQCGVDIKIEGEIR